MKRCKIPCGACSFQQLSVALQMVNTQTLSASRRGSDLSQRLLTHLYTLPPIKPDQSILAIPEGSGHGDICVWCLTVSVFCDIIYLWFHSWAYYNNAVCIEWTTLPRTHWLSLKHPVYANISTRCFVGQTMLYRTRWPFWPFRGRKEGEVSGNRKWMGHLHGNRSSPVASR